MKKVSGVEKVRISLKDGLTVLDLKPENPVTLAELRQIIKNNGFVSTQASLTAKGIASPDGRLFTVSGTGEQLVVQQPPRRRGENWELEVSAPEKP